MSAAERFEGFVQTSQPEGVTFEELVTEGFAGTRQGAVIVVESKVLPKPRMRWLARHIEQLVPDGVVHFASEGLCVVLLRHAGPGQTWLTVERMRRQFTAEQGWERTVVGSATWPVQGSTPMDVIAAALASLYDERARVEQEWGEVELRFEHDEHAERWASAGELLTG